MNGTIHRYWSGPTLPPTEPWVGNVVRGLHPDVRDWGDSDFDSETLAWLDDAASPLPADQRPRLRSNLVRWKLLGELGGIWIDHDVIPLINLATIRRPFIAAHYSPCTCIIGMDKGDPFASAMLAIIAANKNIPPLHNRSSYVAGERLLSDHIPDRVHREQLPFDAAGRQIPGARPWAIHLYSTSAGARP